MISKEEIEELTSSYYKFFDTNIARYNEEQLQQHQQYVNMLNEVLREIIIQETQRWGVTLATASEAQKSMIINEYIKYIQRPIHHVILRTARTHISDRVQHVRDVRNAQQVTAEDLQLADDPEYQQEAISHIYGEQKEKFLNRFCKTVAKETIKNMVQQPSGPPKRPRFN